MQESLVSGPQVAANWAVFYNFLRKGDFENAEKFYAASPLPLPTLTQILLKYIEEFGDDAPLSEVVALLRAYEVRNREDGIAQKVAQTGSINYIEGHLKSEPNIVTRLFDELEGSKVTTYNNFQCGLPPLIHMDADQEAVQPIVIEQDEQPSCCCRVFSFFRPPAANNPNIESIELEERFEH